MHEYGLMEAVLVRALDEARTRGASSVTRLDVDVGEIASASPEDLRTAFQALSKGTLLEGAELRLAEIPSRVRCETCDRDGSPKDLGLDDRHEPGPFLCPGCGGFLEVLGGRGVTLRELLLTVPDLSPTEEAAQAKERC